MSENLQAIIENAFEQRAAINAENADAKLKAAVNEVIQQLDCGQLRVASKENGEWVTHQWVKKAVLLSFRLDNSFMTEIPGVLR